MTSTLRFCCRLVLLIGLVSFGTVDAGHAQAPLGEGQGTATIEGWPRSLPELLDEMGQKAPYLLPRIDSLALDYRYAVTDTASRWSFVLSWRPAERVLYEGDVLPWREGPRDIRMTNVEFRADVRVDGEERAEMIVGVDSMRLRPQPDRFAFNVTVHHERVFLDTPASEARRILSKGITLDPLIVERMGFTAAGTQQRGGPDHRRDAGRPPDEARRPSIYAPRTNIRIGWRIGPRPYYVGEADRDDHTRTERPRGETVGRATGENQDEGSVGRRGEQTGKRGEPEGDAAAGGTSGDDSGDADDEDEPDLLVPALGAVVAVAAVGYAGGTVGLYGRGDTPIGLAAGHTTPSGGVQLQAAVNSAVIEDGPNQKLTVKALGFYDVFGARMQPAAGLGVHVNPEPDHDVQPSVSPGLVGNFGRFVLYGGFDVVQGTPEVGVTYNFRHGGSGETESQVPR